MSYEYLRQEKVIPFPLCKRDGMIGKDVLEVSPGEEERAMRLHRGSIVIDFHNHVKLMPENPNVTRALVVRGYSDEDIRKIIGGNVLRLLEKTIG